MTTTGQVNLQDSFLNQICLDQIPVIVYLKSGVALRGVVKSFDVFTVIVEDEEKQQIVYKHTISTISPIQKFLMKR